MSNQIGDLKAAGPACDAPTPRAVAAASWPTLSRSLCADRGTNLRFFEGRFGRHTLNHSCSLPVIAFSYRQGSANVSSRSNVKQITMSLTLTGKPLSVWLIPKLLISLMHNLSTFATPFGLPCYCLQARVVKAGKASSTSLAKLGAACGLSRAYQTFCF